MRRAIEDQRGFTLIELLVVIMIIGLLAEIAIPSFLGQAAKGHDAAAKSAVNTAQTAVETYRISHGDYCGITPSLLRGIEPALDQAGSLSVSVSSCAHDDNTEYTVAVTSSSALSTVYSIRVAGGQSFRTCSNPGKGGCPPSGIW